MNSPKILMVYKLAAFLPSIGGPNFLIFAPRQPLQVNILTSLYVLKDIENGRNSSKETQDLARQYWHP